MEWLISFALLPLLFCGVMCVGGMLLAFFGIRRATRPFCRAPTPGDEQEAADDDDFERL